MKNALQKSFLQWTGICNSWEDVLRPTARVKSLVQSFHKSNRLKESLPATVLVEYYDKVLSEVNSLVPTTQVIETVSTAHAADSLIAARDLGPQEKRWTGKIGLLLPLFKTISPFVAIPWLSLMKDYSNDLFVNWRIGDGVIANSRSWLANDAIENHPELEWTFWLDDDVIPPFGRGPLFKDIIRNPNFPDDLAAVNVLNRLIAGGQKIIGGTYWSRNEPRTPIFDGSDPSVVNAAASGSGQLFEVQWVGTGCLLVHRDVYLAIKQAYPELAPSESNPQKPYFDYFRSLDGYGEDISFSIRAARCGFPVYLDTGVQCAHVGSYGFTRLGGATRDL